MKILLCHNHYQLRGGEDLVFADEAALLESRGHKVLRFTLHNDQIREIGKLKAARMTVWNGQAKRDVIELINRERPEIVHCTNVFPLLSPAIYYAARQAGVPVLQSLHNYRMLCPRGDLLRKGKICESCVNKLIPWPCVWHRCYRDSRSGSAVVAGASGIHRSLKTWKRTVDRYIAPSEFTRRKYIAGGFPGEKIVVKPNFVIQDSGIGTGAGKYFVYIGRLADEKGIEKILSTWSQLERPLPLKIVGDGPLAPLVEAAAARDDRIEWLGQRSFEDVLAILGEAAALVFPSVCYETFGRSIVESFSKGTPVIASQHGAAAELIDEGRTGWLFDVDRPADLASKIETALSDPDRLMAMRQIVRNEFELKYTASANYEMLMKIYQRAINDVSQSEDSPATSVRLQVSGATITPDDSRAGQLASWPAKRDVFGVKLSPTNYETATSCIINAARNGIPGVVSCTAVHAVVTVSCDAELRDKVNEFEMVCPDGQPVRWALNLLHGTQLQQRVYGPELMLRLCGGAAEQGVGIYLYGGSPDVSQKLPKKLQEIYPQLRVVGSESPPYRPLTADEDAAVIKRINDSGAGIVFIGLGHPKQDQFASAHRDSIKAVQVCVGAAFDFHAGAKSMAPAWMQHCGLEWVFRLCQEPRRLWKRYLVTNSIYVGKLAAALLRRGSRKPKADVESA